MGNPTMWFEVAGKDQQALKGFYSQLFDWQMTDMEAMPLHDDRHRRREGIPGWHRRGAGGRRRPRHLLRPGRRHRGLAGQGRVAWAARG